MFWLPVLFLFKDPPNLEGYESLVWVTEKTSNKFSLQIDHRLLNNTNGPITHVGVLVTYDPPSKFFPSSF